MKYAMDLKDKLCKEVDRIGKKTGDLTEKDLEYAQKMTDTVKNILKIEMLEGEGESYRSYDDDMSMARRRRSYDSYNDGESYARRGQHYVRGHYSYDDGMSNARDRHYSYGDAKEKVLDELGEAMRNADGRQREILKKAMREIEEG